MLSGVIFYGIMYARYRNKSARHVYEKETKKNVSNMARVDQLVEHKKRLQNYQIEGKNNEKLEGEIEVVTSKIMKGIEDIQKNINK